jgi:hypothetical protein
LEGVLLKPNMVLCLPPTAPGSLRLQEQGWPPPSLPVQLYLDMRAAGGRYEEQAATLREEAVRY